MTPYFLFGLPRSRLAWLANALTYGPSACLFQGLWGCTSTLDLEVKLHATGALRVGNSDCGNVNSLSVLLQRWPDAPLVVIRRDVDQVKRSLQRVAPQMDPGLVDVALARLDEAAQLKQTLVAHFDELNDVSVGEAIWNHCVPDTPFNAHRWTMLSELNVQADPVLETAKYAAMVREKR